MDLHQVDEYLEALAAKLLDARRHRNTLVQASRLPPEILGEIFLHRRAESATGDLRWIAVSHISHSWRVSALNHPTLWNAPDLRRLEVAAEMMRRARSGPLDVQMSWTVNTIPPIDQLELQRVLSQVIDAPSRIRSLVITGHLSEVEAVMLLVAASSQWLKKLEIETPGVSAPVLVTSGVTTRRYPALETLSGNPESGLSWEGPLLRSCPNLRHLQLTCEWAGPLSHASYDMDEMLDTLQGLPLLETLTLIHKTSSVHGPFPSWQFDDPIRPVTRCVELVHLQKLTLHGHTSVAVQNLLKHLALSGLCRTSVECEIWMCIEGQDRDHVELRSAARALIHRAFQPTPRSVRLDLSKNGLHVFTLSEDATAVRSSDESTHAIFFHRPYTEDEFMDVFKTLAPLLSGLPLSLNIRQPAGCEERHWGAFLRNNHAARIHFKWHGETDYMLRDFLRDVGAVLSAHDDALPQLDTLVLQGIDFRESDRWDITKSDAVGRIVGALRKRVGAGTFRALRFIGCTNEEQNDLAQWKTLLPLLEWEAEEEDIPSASFHWLHE